MNNALTVSSLNKTFGNTTAAEQISLEVRPGQILAVLGPSGCGKTTLLRCIAGFEIPDSGRIEIGGRLVYGPQVCLPPEKRRVGYVPQEGALFPHLTVAHNVAFGLPRRQRTPQNIAEMLELVGMGGLEKRMPHELSGGQQQRVALARALAPSPSLVLLDEPFSSLDARLRESLREEVRQSLKQAGATAVIVTHDQEEALSMADAVSVIRNGRLIQTDDPAAIYHFPADLSAAAWIGEGIFIPAEIREGTAHCVFGPLPVDRRCRGVSGRASLMIRPEQVAVGPSGEGLPARVAGITYFGHDSLVHLRVDALPQELKVSARVLGKIELSEDDAVGLRVKGNVIAYPPAQ